MGENEELEVGLAGLFVSGSAEQTGAMWPGLGTEGQAGLISDETENLSQATAASDSVDDVAEVVEADMDGDSSYPERQDIFSTAGPEGSPSASPGGSDVHLIVFALNDEQYGISIASVDSIIRPRSVTAIPRAPDFVEGVTNLRGTVLPVVDLKRRLGLHAADMTRDTRIIVAELDGNKVGMLVDAVVEVRRVPDANIEPPSPLVSTVDASLVIGIAKVEDERLIILLDLDQVLAQQ